ncbi:unnamed protein product [Vitrella brassicaformis CCMP3155]|uniref:Peptidase S1 domain-containing protein n=1 Tax=Vitrella brassicaformis (strain CCMP3155) TaxID=1169540 RepID=A0A0G4FUT9_VITBC|nr:unnamed protein product [Vitrella brassicaformis CCMP3155]|eukprot:CEM18490.1 unnamed protein product [Vitrella brassicaformis CCMP3155]
MLARYRVLLSPNVCGTAAHVVLCDADVDGAAVTYGEGSHEIKEYYIHKHYLSEGHPDIAIATLQQNASPRRQTSICYGLDIGVQLEAQEIVTEEGASAEYQYSRRFGGVVCGVNKKDDGTVSFLQLSGISSKPGDSGSPLSVKDKGAVGAIVHGLSAHRNRGVRHRQDPEETAQVYHQLFVCPLDSLREPTGNFLHVPRSFLRKAPSASRYSLMQCIEELPVGFFDATNRQTSLRDYFDAHAQPSADPSKISMPAPQQQPPTIPDGTPDWVQPLVQAITQPLVQSMTQGFAAVDKGLAAVDRRLATIEGDVRDLRQRATGYDKRTTTAPSAIANDMKSAITHHVRAGEIVLQGEVGQGGAQGQQAGLQRVGDSQQELDEEEILGWTIGNFIRDLVDSLSRPQAQDIQLTAKWIKCQQLAVAAAEL